MDQDRPDVDTPAKWAELVAASTFAKPKAPDKAHGDFAPNKHFVVQYDDVALSELTVSGSEVKGVSKFFFTKGTKAAGCEATGYPVWQRERFCGCGDDDCNHLKVLSQH